VKNKSAMILIPDAVIPNLIRKTRGIFAISKVHEDEIDQAGVYRHQETQDQNLRRAIQASNTPQQERR
jgi:hypothetical protein